MFRQRQRADALTSGGEDRIAYRRQNRRQRRFAEPGGRGTCGRSYPSTSTFTLIVALRQSKQTVTGSFDLEMVPGPGAVIATRKDTGSIAGQVEEDGVASLSGQTFLEGRPQFEVRDWRSRPHADGTLSGRFTLFAASTGPPVAQAPLVIEYELLNVRRASP